MFLLIAHCRDGELRGLLDLSAALKKAYTDDSNPDSVSTLPTARRTLSRYGLYDRCLCVLQKRRPLSGKSISMIFQKRSTRTR